MIYTPSEQILKRYAKVMVRFALGGGNGIKSGDTVYLVSTEDAKPLFIAIRNEILDAGGHVITNYMPASSDRYQVSRDFYERAKPHQLKHFPKKYMRGLVDEIDHYLYIIADANPHELKGVDPKKIMEKGKAVKPFMEWRTEKENQGKLTWSLCLYGTPAMAKEARLTEEEYWQQIIKACYLDETDPVAKWKVFQKEIDAQRKKMNALSKKVDRLHVEGVDVDLWISLGEKRQWLGGGGRNIPSFELFTSPDWRGTEGWIKFNQPLYRYGNLIEGIELEFKKGKVIRASAKQNEHVLKAMIATPGADKIGEFSLTDKRHSRITKFMANTLFDENMGGPQGNTHIALGMAYKDTLVGDPAKLKKADWVKLGFNDSAVHTDIISTAPRTVTAHLKNGTQQIVYRDGSFIL